MMEQMEHGVRGRMMRYAVWSRVLRSRMLRSRMLRSSMLVVALCVIGQRANAQHSELESRLPVSLRGAVVALADSVANVGLPRAPIIDKALEGVSKGADDRKILAAIRVVADNLGVARQALGAKAAPGEMTAGAAALRAGVSVNTLAQIRKTLPGRTLTVPLSVLSALVVQGVAAPTAAEVVVAQAKRDDDGRLLVLGQDAVRRLAAGVPAQVVVATFSTFGANVGDNRNIGGVPTPSQKSLIRKVKP